MAHAFSPIPAKSAFGNITQSDYASDYIQNKIAKLAYCSDVRNANCKKKFSQSELLLFNKGRLLNSYAFCVGKSLINEANLVAGLYTDSDLSGVAIVCDVSGDLCITPTSIDSLKVPFYEHYLIDPDGQLFGNTPCGMTNFTKYMSVPVISILGPPTDLQAVGGVRSVLLSWTAPMTNDNSPVSEYNIYWASNDDYILNLTPSNASTTTSSSQITTDVVTNVIGWNKLYMQTIEPNYTIHELTDNNIYWFKVEAVGLLGGGAKGSFSESVSATTLNIPGLPTNINVVETLGSVALDGSGQVSLSWTAPISSAIITSYLIKYYNNGSVSLPIPSPTTSITLSGLNLTNPSYSFSVAAVNSVGSGDYSNPVQYTLHKFTINGSRSRLNYGNTYASYTFNPTTTIANVSSSSFMSNIDMQINFLIIGSGTSGQFNRNGVTSSGGGSGGIMQGTLQLKAGELINIDVGSGGRYSSQFSNGNKFMIGVSGEISSISNSGRTGIIQAGFCPAGSASVFQNEITPSIITELRVSIPVNVTGLLFNGQDGQVGPGVSGVSGEMIHLYDGSYNIICSSSGGGGAGSNVGVTSYLGGVGGTGAGNGGGSGHNGTNAISWGSGGGGAGSTATDASYGVGANGVVIIYFKYPLTTITPTIVNKPTNLLATGVDDGSVTLTWSAPSGPSVTDYSIYYSDNSDNNYPWYTFNHFASNSTTIDVQGLTNGTLYYFKITALIDFDESDFSNMVQATPIAPIVYPNEPIHLVATHTIDSSSVFIEWYQSDDKNITNRTITDYSVKYSNDNQQTWSTFQHDPLIAPQYSTIMSGVMWDASINVTDLSSNTLYYFQVAAVIAGVVSSDYSNPASRMTAPDPPNNLTADPSDSSITLSWFAPSNMSNIHYGINYNTDEASLNDVIDISTNDTSYNIAELNNGTLYYFRVWSINSGGNSLPVDASATPFHVGPITIPLTAPIITSVIIANSHIEIYWIPPTGSDTGGSPITSCLIHYEMEGNQGGWWDSGENISNPYILPNYITFFYTFTMIAINKIGQSLPSSPMPSPYVKPGIPQIESFVSGNEQIKVLWSPPFYVGGASITNHIIQYISDNSIDNISDNSIWTTRDISGIDLTTNRYPPVYSPIYSTIISGLTYNTEYWFKIALVTSAGMGLYCASIPATTLPDHPNGLKAKPSNESVILSWTAPSDSTNIYYGINYSTDEASLNDVIDISTNDTSYNITGLNNGTLYYFRVWSINSGGNSLPVYASATPTAIISYPDSPTDLNGGWDYDEINPTNSELSIHWIASPSTPSSNIQYYIHYTTDTTQPGFYENSITTSSTSCSISDVSFADTIIVNVYSQYKDTLIKSSTSTSYTFSPYPA